MVKKITRLELQSQLRHGESVVLVEALPEKNYNEEHLPGAINIPHDKVPALADALLPDKASQIVVYCANGPCKNSGIAAQRLYDLGYHNVRDYHDGKQDWIEAGLPTEGGRVKKAG